MSDFGNSETFLVDGDALVGWVFADQNNAVDFVHSGQLLHAGMYCREHAAAVVLNAVCPLLYVL